MFPLQRDAALADPADRALAAVAAGALQLALQPIRPAARPAAIAFHEGLARLPCGLSPALFVPALEVRGRIAALDRAALALGLAALAGDPGLRLAVNVSARTLGDPGWHALLAGAAARDPDAVRRLIVELTETAAPDPGRALAFRDAVARSGAAFALDDFGAGHACAALARALRPDVLKLDRSLSQGLARGGAEGRRAADALAEAMDIAAELEALTVAEGVGSAAEAALLAACGVDCVQGFAFGRPELRAA